MVVVYVDTNVIIARYKPNDPLYSVANKLFENNYDFVISPVTLVELYSVLSHVKPFLKFKRGFENVNIDTILAFILYDSKLRIVARNFMSKMQILSKKFRFPLEYYLAIRFAKKFSLRTLDLLHIAYAYILRNMIDYVITGDHDILKIRGPLRQYIGLEIKEPTELI